MIQVNQSTIPFLTTTTEGIKKLIFIHQFKTYLQRNWYWYVIGFAAILFLTHRIRQNNRIQAERIQAMVKRQALTNSKIDSPPNTLSNDALALIQLIEKRRG